MCSRFCAMDRCPELEMGKNSATPWTRPSRKEEKKRSYLHSPVFQITFCLFLPDYSDLYSFKKYGYIYTIAHSGEITSVICAPGKRFPRAGPQKGRTPASAPDLYPNNRMHHQMAPMTDMTSPSREHDAPGQVRGLELFRVVIEKAQQEFVQGDGGLQQQSARDRVNSAVCPAGD